MRPVVPWCSPLHSPGGKNALCWEVISKYAKCAPFLAAKMPFTGMWSLKQISFATDLWPEVYWWDELSNACYCWHIHEGRMWGNICNNGTINLLKVYLIYVPTDIPVLYLFMIDCMEQWSNLSIPYSIIIKCTLKDNLKRNGCSNWQVWEGVWVGGRWQLPLVLRASSWH